MQVMVGLKFTYFNLRVSGYPQNLKPKNFLHLETDFLVKMQLYLLLRIYLDDKLVDKLPFQKLEIIIFHYYQAVSNRNVAKK